MRATTHQAEFRVFISSPGDVKAEREAAERVVRRIGGIYVAHVDIVVERWEGKFYQATASFQEQIEATSAFDLVVGVLWKRIGTGLRPDLFARSDGTAFESGTVLELESALEASATRGGKPAVFVFRKEAEILFSKRTLADEKAQNELLDAWWNRTFRDADGRFRRAAEGFMTTQEFETRFENLLVDQLRGKGLIPDAAVWEIEVKGSPYPGLEPYSKERRSVLFGRSLAIRDACEELITISRAKEGLPALFVIGPSGSGKSSLVRGGIAPELTDPGTVPDVDCWRCITVEGDAGLLEALATQLYRDEALPELAESPRKVPASWAQLSAEAPKAAAEDIVWALDRVGSAERLRTGADRTLQTALLLVVDQLERMFGTADAAKVPALLRELAVTRRVWLIATLRSDRYAALQADPDLLELRRHGTVYDLPPPGEAEIIDIVKGPARAAGLVFQDGDRGGKTLARVLVENTPSADALPLLQMSLRQLFDARDGMTLTWQAYEAIGGVSGAIARHADAVLAGLQPAVRSELPALVSKLTRDVTREASGRIRFTATAADAGWAATPARQALVNQMVKERLLVKDALGSDREVLRVAHEALLRQWRPANSALEAIADRALRRARFLQIAALASAVVFLLVAAGAGWFYRQAKVAEKKISEDASRAHVFLARDSLEAGKDAEALAHLAQALRLNPGDYAAVSLTAALLARTDPVQHSTVVMEHDSDVASAHFSPDGQRVLTVSGNAAWLWEAATGQPLSAPLRHAGGKVNSAQFSRDGQRIVTASQDKTARLWDAASGQLLGKPTNHDAGVKGGFSPDGQRVVTNSMDVTARLWDIVTGEALSAPMKHDGWVLWAQFSPDSQRVVTASEDQTARLWDVASGQLLGKPMEHDGWVLQAQFSPDGQRVVTASNDRTARLWDAASGQPVGAAMEHESWVKLAQFSPDGGRVLTASGNAARLWDAATGQALGAPLRHEGPVVSAKFSPDGQCVVTASFDKTARLWNAVTGEPLGAPLEHEGPVLWAQFSPEGLRVVTASEDKTARLWDAGTGQPLSGPLRHEGPVISAQFDPEGRRVITASWDKTARLWDAATEPLDAALRHEGGVLCAQFSPDGCRVLTASEDGTARLWDAASGQLLGKPMKHDGWVLWAQFSPDGQRVVTASGDQTARLWDAASGQLLGKPMKHDGWVLWAQFSPDGQRVITASGDQTARLWDAATGKALGEPMKHDDQVSSAKFSPDGHRVVTASADKTARVWDAATGKALGEPMKHDEQVNSAQFSPDGQRVLTASGNAARLWDAATGQPLSVSLRHEGKINSAQFSRDGQRIVTASEDQTARLWNAASGRLLGKPMKHDGWVVWAQFSPDGQRVVTASNDRTARLWDAATGLPLSTPLRHGGAVLSAQFSPDGQRVVTVSDDKAARLWDVPTITDQDTAGEVQLLADLAEVAGGLALQVGGQTELLNVVTPEQVRATRAKIAADLAGQHLKLTPIQQLLKWAVSERMRRTLSPFSKITVAEWVEAMIEEGTLEGLRAAMLADPANARLAARFGRCLAGYAVQEWSNSDRDGRMRREADFQTRRALELAPDSLEAQALRAETVKLLQLNPY